MIKRHLALFTLAVLAGSAIAAPCPSLSWVPGQKIANIGYMRSITSLDFDNDGKLDVVAAVGGERDKLLTFRGLGNGTFESPVTLLTSDSPVGGTIPDVDTADVDSDGLADLVVSYNGLLRVYRGTGSGLSAPVDQSLNLSFGDIAIGNFDGDPAPELVVASASARSFVAYDNNGTGTFVETGRVANLEFWPMDVTSADYDGDGRFDVAISHRRQDDSGTVDVFFRNANGTYAPAIGLPAGSFPIGIKSADFDGNGRPDIAVTNWYDNTVNVYRNEGSRQFTSTTISVDYPGKIGDADPLLARDVNGDGVPDLVVGSINGGWATTLIGVGNGTFRTPTYIHVIDESTFPMPFNALTAGDYDNDGDIDLAAGAAQSLLVSAPSCATEVRLIAESPLISSGTEAVLNVTISGFGSSTPQPYGTVTLRKDNQTVTTANVGPNGKATLTVPGLTTGSHAFLADFNGNADVAGATSNETTQNVTDATTQTIVHFPTTEPLVGDTMFVTVSVEGGGYSGFEYIKLFVDGVPTLYYTSQNIRLELPVGPHSIYAKFYGTQYRPASTSATTIITVQKRNPSFSRQAGPTTVRLGQAHSLEFAVTGAFGVTPPSGTVQLFSGATLLGSGAIASGLATVTVTLPRGAHDVRAVYSGNDQYNSQSLDLTLNVVANQNIAIDARGLASSMHIAYVLPDGYSSYALYRRTGGGAWQLATGWNAATGVDAGATQRGVVYEYQLHAEVYGSTVLSNIDGALLFTDEPVNAGHTVKRVHFTELRDAVNFLRSAAGLAPFSFNSNFTSSPLVRAEHLLGLRTAATEARAALGMPAVTWTEPVAAGTVIRVAPIRELREAVR